METICQHHWLINSPNGESEVKAICKKCQAIRDFRVAYEEPVGIYEKTHIYGDLVFLIKLFRERKEI